jgi:peroxiredoxin
MSLQIGQQAPDFQLYDTEKNLVTLSELKGHNVVLLFFPFAFTGVCTAEMCSVRDDMSTYEGLDAHVFGISVDSLHSLKRFKADQNLNFSLLSDFNKVASNAYETIYEVFAQGTLGVSKRSAFVIDKEGIIRYVEVLENAGEVPNLAAVKAVLAEI